MTPAEWERIREDRITRVAARAKDDEQQEAIYEARVRHARRIQKLKRRHCRAKLKGRRFGHLLADRQAPKHLWRDHQTCWLCICDCGCLCTVRQKSLLNDDTRSCGCKSRHSNLRHGLYKTPEYSAWCRMRRELKRLAVPMYPPWSNFAIFLAHVGSRPSDDHAMLRLDHSRGNEPGNVAWRPKSEIAQIGLAGLRKKWARQEAA